MALGRARTFLREKVFRRPPRAQYKDPRGDWSLLEKTSRQVSPRGLVAGSRISQGLWVPVTRPEGLVLLTDLVWILGAGVDRVVEETTKGGWDFEPLFQAMCALCGAEYDVEPEMCETPGCFAEEFEQADPQQLHGGSRGDGGILALLERPNWDPKTGQVTRSFKDLLKDATFYNNVIGWWNWEVIYDAVGRPAQLHAMNSESMRVVEDPNLTLPGSWFCPACHEEKEDIDRIFHRADQGEESPTCPEHRVLLKRPSWVQLGEGDVIVAVWAADEVLSDMPRARGYRHYPRSKVHRVWSLGQTMRWTERFDLAALSGQRSPDAMVTVGGRNQGEVNRMLDSWEDWRKDHPEYEGVIWLGLGTESGEVKIHHFLGDLINRDFIAWGEAAMKAVAINLGVSFVFVGGQEAGKLGKSEEQLQVSYDTIEENQAQDEEFVNGKLLPLFPEVTHWRFVMKPPAPEDMEKKANEAAAWANAVAAFRAAGANAKLDSQADFDWPIIIEDWEARQEQPETVPGEVPDSEGAPQAPPPSFPPEELSVISKGWSAFTTRSGKTGAVNDQGRKVYGEEAKRVLARREPAGEDEEGKPRGPGDRFTERRVGDSGVSRISRQRTLGEGWGFQLQDPGSPLTAFALGGEERTSATAESAVSRTYEATGVTVDYDVVETGIEGGKAGRFLLKPSHFHGPVAPGSKEMTDRDVDWSASGSLIWREVDGEPAIVDILVEEGMRGVGLGSELVEAFERRFGKVRVMGPFSQEGAALIERRFPDAIEVVDMQVEQKAATEKSLTEKSLTARSIPREDAVAGIRKAEDELAGKLKKRLDKAARDFKRAAGRRPSEIELRRLTADVANGLQEEFGRLGEEYVGKAYRLGLEEEKTTTPEASFEARDRLTVRWLADHPDFLKGRLSKMVADATGVIGEEIRTALLEGEDTGTAARRAADMLGEEAWKVERIVRSDTTNIANAGRITQFEKHGRSEDEYGFSSARDRRRCPICKAADEGVGTLTAAERAEVERAGYDPGLLHGNPYTLTEVKGLWQAHRSFHSNCRCTVRRHVALT